MMRLAAMLVLGGVSTPCLAATPQTDLVGAQTEERAGSGSFKLTIFDVVETVELDTFEFYTEPFSDNTELYFVVYENIGNGWDLHWNSGLTAVSPGLDYHGPGPVGLMLEDGHSYAIGVHIPEGQDISYFYGVASEVDLGWARADDSLWTPNGSFGGGPPPDPALGNNSTTPDSAYHLRIRTLHPEDADGDGFLEFDDCDDSDPTVFPGANEVCDGIDTNCDGSLLTEETTDADQDGSPSCLDCDDSDPDTFPGANDPCNDQDNDCDGVIPSGDQCEDDFLDEELVVAPCACNSGPAGGLAWFVVLGLVAARRRS